MTCDTLKNKIYKMKWHYPTNTLTNIILQKSKYKTQYFNEKLELVCNEFIRLRSYVHVLTDILSYIYDSLSTADQQCCVDSLLYIHDTTMNLDIDKIRVLLFQIKK